MAEWASRCVPPGGQAAALAHLHRFAQLVKTRLHVPVGVLERAPPGRVVVQQRLQHRAEVATKVASVEVPEGLAEARGVAIPMVALNGTRPEIHLRLFGR